MTLNPAKDPSCVLAFDWTEAGGNTVYDLSGKGNHGTIYGAVRTRGILRYAGSFDGVDDYVGFAHTGGLDPTGWNEITILAWVYPQTLSTTTLNAVVWLGYKVVLYNNKGRWEIWYHDGISGIISYTTSDFVTGKWVFLGGVLNVPAGYIEIYTQGQLRRQRSAGGTPRNAPELNGIGARASVNRYNFNGLIGSVRVYNKAKSEKFIKESYYYGISMLKQRIPSKYVYSPLRV